MNKQSISPLTSVALGVVLIGWTCSWSNWYGRHCWQGRGRRRHLHRFQMIWRTCCRCYAFVLHTSVMPGGNVWERAGDGGYQTKRMATNLPFGFKVNFRVTGHRRPTGMYFHMQPSSLRWHKRKDEMGRNGGRKLDHWHSQVKYLILYHSIYSI